MKFGFIGAVAILVALAGTASARPNSSARGIISDDDGRAFKALMNRSLRLSSDNDEAVRGAKSRARSSQDDRILSCLLGIRDGNQDVIESLSMLSTVILLGTEMVDSRDETKVVVFARIENKSVEEAIEMDRRLVKGAAKMCPSSAYVSNQATTMLNFYNETLTAVQSLQQKIGS